MRPTTDVVFRLVEAHPDDRFANASSYPSDSCGSLKISKYETAVQQYALKEQNMISAGTTVRRTANREPRTVNLWLIAAEGHSPEPHVVDKASKRAKQSDLTCFPAFLPLVIEL